jgi:predicted acylesterase/phospholipase RssA
MTIKNIVLSGGGYNGLCMLGTISYLLEREFVDFNKIEKIYGTSFGALCGFIICLKIKWNEVIEYFIERPWDKMVNVNVDSILDMISKKGLLDESFIHSLLEKLIISCGLEKDITFEGLYEYNNIELHSYHVELNKLVLVDCSYKTHPNMKVLDAIYSSCCLPFLFTPSKIDNKLCIDGGVLCAFPLNKCIESGTVEDEILAIEIIHSHNEKPIEDKSNIMDYGIYLFLNLMRRVNNKQKKIKNYIALPCDSLNMQSTISLIKNKRMREEYIENGKKIGITFLESGVDKFL